ncbi:MAG: type II toxin-antitoxin system HicA family toxin [Dehalococcoidales bacterium]|nr:type II toxin-antitoxin system HicA family toxin [Dehalococcoidales bacterium]
MPHSIPRLTAAEVNKILQKCGFTLISQRGSHQKWRNYDSGRQVIVPFHQGKQLPLGTMKSIIDGSNIPIEEFKNRE